MQLLRQHKQLASRVVCHQLDAILWLDQHGNPQTSFLVERDGTLSVGDPFAGFVV